MSYIGNTPTTQSFISGTDYFNGTGSQTAFTLSRTVASINDIQVTVNNVVQQPNDAYTISGTTLTMTSAPSAGTNNVYVRYLSTTTQAITPSQNTVSWNTLDSNVQQDLGLMGKNKIINGNMVIDQRNAGAAVTADGAFPVDRFNVDIGSSWAYSGQRDTSAPAGFTNSLKITTTTASGALSATQYNSVLQVIEGFNVADLNWGSANAKTVTLSFWTQSSVTGTHSGALTNSGNSRSYPFTYTISSANTWEQKTVTIAGDTSGTWLTTNGIGVIVWFSMGTGTTYSGTAGAWAGTTYVAASGATGISNTLNATWYLTGVQLEVGTQATTFTTAGGSYGAELALCQRYYEVAGQGIVGIPNSTTGIYALVNFKVTKRTTPSVSLAITNPTCIQWGISNRTASGATVASTYMNAVGGSIRVEGFSSVTTGSSGGFVDDNTFQFSAEL
jgi:hypothetical protein